MAKEAPENVPVLDAEAGDTRFIEDRRMRIAISRNVRDLEGDSLKAVLETSRREIEKLSDLVFERVRIEEFGREPSSPK